MTAWQETATTASGNERRGRGDLAAEVKAASGMEPVVALPVPYSLPPASYGGQDEPWAVDVPRGGLDALGLSWGTPFSHYGHKEPASDGEED